MSSLNEILLREWEREAATTLALLNAVPDDRLDFRAHAKSYAIGELITHLAQIPSWGEASLGQDVYELDPSSRAEPVANTAQAHARFLEHSEKLIAGLRAVSEASLWETWTMKIGGKVMLQMPRYAVVRDMIFNHIIHHRAQLGVSLRLLGVPLPRTYGPTADQPTM